MQRGESDASASVQINALESDIVMENVTWIHSIWMCWWGTTAKIGLGSLHSLAAQRTIGQPAVSSAAWKEEDANEFICGETRGRGSSRKKCWFSALTQTSWDACSHVGKNKPVESACQVWASVMSHTSTAPSRADNDEDSCNSAAEGFLETSLSLKAYIILTPIRENAWPYFCRISGKTATRTLLKCEFLHFDFLLKLLAVMHGVSAFFFFFCHPPLDTDLVLRAIGMEVIGRQAVVQNQMEGWVKTKRFPE